MTLHLSPVRRRKLYEEIVDRLEALMLDGTLAPGDQLPSERELMVTFQVGRTAVREALFALSRMGLISLQNGAKLYVNYCLGCHSMQYMRYNRLTELGLTDDQIEDNLLFTHLGGEYRIRTAAP